MRRQRNAKIVATLGPASSEPSTIRELFARGVDVFRVNFSHGSDAEHRRTFDAVRQVEALAGRPIAILADLQGPKLRVGTFQGGAVHLDAGAAFRFDLDETPGDATRVCLPHPEIFEALRPGEDLLLDDGKLRVRVQSCSADHACVQVIAGGRLSDRKGVNVPGVILPLPALTAKDLRDLRLALELKADWIALSFVQRPEDLVQARALVEGRAGIVTKLEKPSAIARLDEILALTDAAMVARGDLGVELAAEEVPAIQKRVVRACRALGKPVIVATQMLESMIHSPVPTRAETSDVAGAVYEGADAVMLSAETAAGRYPVEAVAVMDRVIARVEQDPACRRGLDQPGLHDAAGEDVSEVICAAAARAAALLPAAAIVCYTTSGSTGLRVARERPVAPVLALTPSPAVARRLALGWGIHAVHFAQAPGEQGLVATAAQLATRELASAPGDHVVTIAGAPFGQVGSTNFMGVGRVPLPR